MISYFKRLARFILLGQPEVKVTAKVTTISDKHDLSGKKVLITGGGRGLGLAIAQKCLERGAQVIISGRNKEVLIKACEQNQGMKYIPFDVCSFGHYDELLNQCEEILGGTLDTIVNNAGISLHEGWYEAVTEETWDKQFNTNLKAPYFLTQEFIRHALTLPKEKSKKIIFISSSRGLYCDDIPYGLIKAAINSLTAGLGRRLLDHNFFVNAIAPGVTVSDMTGYTSDGNLYRPQACAKRVYLPEEVAEATCFLISDVSNCISSQVIPTQNGNHLRCDC